MGGDRFGSSWAVTSQQRYLDSLPKHYIKADGTSEPVPFSMLEVGVMQGLADGLDNAEIAKKLGGRSSYAIKIVVDDLGHYMDPVTRGFSQRRKAFIAAIGMGILDLNGVKPRGLSGLTTTEVRVIGLVSEGVWDTEIFQELGVGLKTLREVRGYLKTLAEKLGLNNEFQLIALGIMARRQSE